MINLKAALVALVAGFAGGPAIAAEGLVTRTSDHSALDTLDRLESAAKARGLTIFARIDHAAGAAAIGQELRPAAVLIFGNAKGGTPLMQEEQTIGLDLPLKVLVWQDEKGVVRIGYNDPAWLARRHGADPRGPAVANLAAILTQLAETAAR